MKTCLGQSSQHHRGQAGLRVPKAHTGLSKLFLNLGVGQTMHHFMPCKSFGTWPGQAPEMSQVLQAASLSAQTVVADANECQHTGAESVRKLFGASLKSKTCKRKSDEQLARPSFRCDFHVLSRGPSADAPPAVARWLAAQGTKHIHGRCDRLAVPSWGRA